MLTTDKGRYASLLAHQRDSKELHDLIVALKLTPEQVKADSATLDRYLACREATQGFDPVAMAAELEAAQQAADAAEAAAREARQKANAIHQRYGWLADRQREMVALKSTEIVRHLGE